MKDIHEETARKLFHIPADREVPEYSRRVAKTINFGIMYGMGAKLAKNEVVRTVYASGGIVPLSALDCLESASLLPIPEIKTEAEKLFDLIPQ